MASLPISNSPDVLSGATVFSGTRVPIQSLMDCLRAGETIEDFLAGHPTVSRERVIAVLELAESELAGAG